MWLILNFSSLNELGILSLISFLKPWGRNFKMVVKNIFLQMKLTLWYCPKSHFVNLIEGWWALKVWVAEHCNTELLQGKGLLWICSVHWLKLVEMAYFQKKGLGMALGLNGEMEDFSRSRSHICLASVPAFLRCLFMAALLGGAVRDYGVGAGAFLVTCWGC